MIMVQKGISHLVHKILNSECEIEMQDKEGNTAIFYALQ